MPCQRVWVPGRVFNEGGMTWWISKGGNFGGLSRMGLERSKMEITRPWQGQYSSGPGEKRSISRNISVEFNWWLIVHRRSRWVSILASHGLPCLPPRDLPHPGTGPASPVSPALQVVLYCWAAGEALGYTTDSLKKEAFLDLAIKSPLFWDTTWWVGPQS